MKKKNTRKKLRGLGMRNKKKSRKFIILATIVEEEPIKKYGVRCLVYNVKKKKILTVDYKFLKKHSRSFFNIGKLTIAKKHGLYDYYVIDYIDCKSILEEMKELGRIRVIDKSPA